jgi:hypothetical protein
MSGQTRQFEDIPVKNKLAVCNLEFSAWRDKLQFVHDRYVPRQSGRAENERL